MHEASIQLNRPFETSGLKALLVHAEDFHVLWPGAKFPFHEEEWREFFLVEQRHSFLIYVGDKLIGHFGLVKENQIRYRIVLVYLVPEERGQGLGARILQMAEGYAQKEFGTKEFSLRVQDFNLRAIHLYQKSGFKQIAKEGTSIIMEKVGLIPSFVPDWKVPISSDDYFSGRDGALEKILNDEDIRPTIPYPEY